MKDILNQLFEIQLSLLAANRLNIAIESREYQNMATGVLTLDSSKSQDENALDWIKANYDTCSASNSAITQLLTRASEQLDGLLDIMQNTENK